MEVQGCTIQISQSKRHGIQTQARPVSKALHCFPCVTRKQGDVLLGNPSSETDLCRRLLPCACVTMASSTSMACGMEGNDLTSARVDAIPCSGTNVETLGRIAVTRASFLRWKGENMERLKRASVDSSGYLGSGSFLCKVMRHQK